MNNLLQNQVVKLMLNRPEINEIQAFNICLKCNLKTFKTDFIKRTDNYNQSKLVA